MRRCLPIVVTLLLAAPAAALADASATTRLSSTPESVPAGQPWHVVLTIRQPGRAPRADLAPAIVVRDADGFASTFPARAAKRPGRYAATVTFPKAGQWTYAVHDGLTAAPPEAHPVLIREPAPIVDRPDPVGPTELPIVFAAVLALGAAGIALWRHRHRHPPTRPPHPA
jgi:hypothetical protein